MGWKWKGNLHRATVGGLGIFFMSQFPLKGSEVSGHRYEWSMCARGGEGAIDATWGKLCSI